MVTTVERQQLRQELVSQGYAWEYIDAWPPKVTLYRHAPGLNISGDVVFPVGTAVKGVPGNPDYVAKKSRLGMLPEMPSDTCECRWCAADEVGRAERAARKILQAPVEPVAVQAVPVRPTQSVHCPVCNVEITGASRAGAQSKLRAHAKTH